MPTKREIYNELLEKSDELGTTPTSKLYRKKSEIQAELDEVNAKIKFVKDLTKVQNLMSEYIKSMYDFSNSNRFIGMVNRKEYTEAANFALNNDISDTNLQYLHDKLTDDDRYIAILSYLGMPNKGVTIKPGDNFVELFNPEFFGSRGNDQASDQWDDIKTRPMPTSIEIRKVAKPEGRPISGAFFPYLNISNVDLSRYQIYQNEYEENDKHCLINALELCGCDESVVNSIALAYAKSNSNINKKDLTDLSKKLDASIWVHSYDKQRMRIDKYGNGVNVYKIALHSDHYFIYEDTEYTKCFADNYELLKNKTDGCRVSKIRMNKYEYNKNAPKASSLYLIKKMGDNCQFVVGNLQTQPENNKLKKICMDQIEKEQRPMKIKAVKPKEGYNIVYSDIESFVNGGLHQVALIGTTQGESTYIFDVATYQFDRKAMVNAYLDLITQYGKNNAIAYFHNLKYDFTVLTPYLPIQDICQKDGSVYSSTLKHRGKIIELRDSYKLIPFALSQFAKNFDLPDGKKDAIAYTYYTQENHGQIVKSSVYRAMLPVDEQKTFDENVKTDTFDPLEYYKDYLRADCTTLKAGMEKFNKIIEETTEGKCSIFNYLTISSLTDGYMKLTGCYDDIYEVCGNLREYIAGAVYGGRVHANEKYVKKVIEGKISDYDGCSLYPSAIKRLCDMGGLPRGMAKRLIDLNNWHNHYYAILTVKIKSVKINQQMPMIAHRTKDSIEYRNEPPAEPIIIDKFTLEDYIKFQGVEYEILDGVYWDEGGNPKMGQLIQQIYDVRLKHKKSNPALAQTLKLMLNSSYGKTIIKKSNVKKTILQTYKYVKDPETNAWNKVPNVNVDKHIVKYFKDIKNITYLNDDNVMCEVECADFSYNRAHIGCAILSVSKRIVNEVFDVANSNNYPIYYSDTDSIHMNFDDVHKLESAFKEIYGRDLKGKQLGQFHTDFDMKGAHGEIYATKSLFLGKKSYIDCLESVDKNGNTITGYHCRLKGITEAGMKKAGKDHPNGMFGVYKDLSENKAVIFDLMPFDVDNNKQHVCFDVKKNFVQTRSNFCRTVKY